MKVGTLPLLGIRVLDFGHTVMGPTAGLILADLVANLSQLANLRRIAEAEINPVLVQADGVLILDALIRIQ